MTPLRLCWPDQTELTYDGETVITRYPDETFTGGPVVEQDHEHAALLGITPVEHRLVHEVGHHLIARALSNGEFGCPILWAAAHNVEMPANASEIERSVTAVTYAAFNKPMHHFGDYLALAGLQQAGVNVPDLAAQLRWVLSTAQMDVALVSFQKAA
jgi:hypothetical protein